MPITDASLDILLLPIDRCTSRHSQKYYKAKTLKKKKNLSLRSKKNNNTRDH